MSEAHEPNELDGPHEGPIKTPRQLILAIIFSFVVPIVGIVLLVLFVTSDPRPSAGTDTLSNPQAIAARIKPVGVVEVKDSSDPASLASGDKVYAAQCAACHAAGTLGSPRLGDAAAWAPRLQQGYAALLQSSLAGKGQMPAQRGGDFTDFEIGRAVVYLANQSGGKLAEPPLPLAGASAPSAATATTAALPATTTVAPTAAAPSATAAATAAASAAATVVAAAPAASPPAVYTQLCSVCHISGVAGSPKLGDKAVWAPRIAQGIDALTATVIAGKGAMPPRGGSTATDAEIRTAVAYMVAVSK